MTLRLNLVLALTILTGSVVSPPLFAQSLLVATTTSTENSGLLTYLRPHLE